MRVLAGNSNATQLAASLAVNFLYGWRDYFGWQATYAN
jgi:hypothetical protein